MLKLALIGYGKMGKMVEKLALEKGFEIVSIIDPNVSGAQSQITKEALKGADIAIDFSHPSAILANLEKLIELKQRAVIGTTGWHDSLDDIIARAESAGMGLVYGSNFSLGMNLFLKIAEEATLIFDNFEEYDLLAWEFHHNQKADSPSGSAIELANRILKKSSRKQKVVWDKLDRRPEKDELHFASIRGGKIPGTHALSFDSEEDSITITHDVRSRATFARGALMAAEFIHQKAGVFSFSEIIGELLC
ncbi:MAG TPA: 4-hydroxy-tetrahydrodipicolinate reductase [Candidatus Cloacimonetes bacterium]|nr:4-hydroxy-tetrahydrodipicolinate reductase [Candidatus Cloacimonadota bacterium]